MFGLNPMELMIVGVVAVLLFGNKLPSVARSLGKSVTDFKKGMSGIEEEFRNAGDDSPRRVPKYRDSSEDREEATAPKFEPPAMAPRQEPAIEPHQEDVA
jgi:sec-independent protein translocase protein TatA